MQVRCRLSMRQEQQINFRGIRYMRNSLQLLTIVAFGPCGLHACMLFI